MKMGRQGQVFGALALALGVALLVWVSTRPIAEIEEEAPVSEVQPTPTMGEPPQSGPRPSSPPLTRPVVAPSSRAASSPPSRQGAQPQPPLDPRSRFTADDIDQTMEELEELLTMIALCNTEIDVDVDHVRGRMDSAYNDIESEHSLLGAYAVLSAYAESLTGKLDNAGCLERVDAGEGP